MEVICEMKQIISILSHYLLFWGISFLAVFIITQQILPPQFSSAYQTTILDKYNALQRTGSPKLILIGGSSGAIGFDGEQMENEISMPVVNMALHASFGMKFQTEIVKGNIGKGDIVILAYEYQSWENPDVFDAELVMTGLDGRLDLYRYLQPENYVELIKYFPKYMFSKLDSILIEPYQSNENWVYCRKAFDSDGNLNFEREECIMPVPLETDTYVTTYFSKDMISEDSISYINNFVKYASEKEATVYISFPPFFEEAIRGGDIGEYQEFLSDALDAEIVSSIEEYIFPREYMYDTPYHCNNLGTWVRTHSLAWDIMNQQN